MGACRDSGGPLRQSKPEHGPLIAVLHNLASGLRLLAPPERKYPGGGQALTEDELRRVLTEPRNALIRQYHVQFGQSRAAFHVTRGALAGVAGIARDKGTGARGLRSILEDLLHHAMYEVRAPSSRLVIQA